MKRNKIEIIKDILDIVKDYHQGVKFTPLLRKSNLSFESFSVYYKDLLNKKFIVETVSKEGKKIKISERGLQFIDKYSMIVNFLDEFEL